MQIQINGYLTAAYRNFSSFRMYIRCVCGASAIIPERTIITIAPQVSQRIVSNILSYNIIIPLYVCISVNTMLPFEVSVYIQVYT